METRGGAEGCGEAWVVMWHVRVGERLARAKGNDEIV